MRMFMGRCHTNGYLCFNSWEPVICVLIIVGHDERTVFCYRRFLLFCELLQLSSLNWVECGMVTFVEGQRM